MDKLHTFRHILRAKPGEAAKVASLLRRHLRDLEEAYVRQRRDQEGPFHLERVRAEGRNVVLEVVAKTYTLNLFSEVLSLVLKESPFEVQIPVWS